MSDQKSSRITSVLTIVFSFAGAISGGAISTHFSNEHKEQQYRFERRAAAIEKIFSLPSESTEFRRAAEDFLNVNKYTIYTSKESSKEIVSIIEERNKKNINCSAKSKLTDGCLLFFSKMINVYRKDLGLEIINEDELKILLKKSFNKLNEQLD